MLEEQLKNHREVHQKQLRLLRLSPSKQKRLEEAIVRKEKYCLDTLIMVSVIIV